MKEFHWAARALALRSRFRSVLPVLPICGPRLPRLLRWLVAVQDFDSGLFCMHRNPVNLGVGTECVRAYEVQATVEINSTMNFLGWMLTHRFRVPL